MWCGAGNESILVKTKEGAIYRSRDKGGNWKKLHAQMKQHASTVISQDQEIGHVHTMRQSPVDDNIVVFLGTSGVNWITENCGADMRALNSGKVIEEFTFHPTDRVRGLAASWTNCDKGLEEGDEKCKIFKELYYTEDLGTKWKYLTNYVFNFEWGVTKKALEFGAHIPHDRIWITRESNETAHLDHQNMEAGVRGTWGPSVNLYMSDDIFATTPKVMLESANTIMKTDSYMFFSVSSPTGNVVKMHTSSYKSGFTHILESQLPDGEVNFGHSFTIIDSSEDTVFMFLENHGFNSPFGSLYISD